MWGSSAGGYAEGGPVEDPVTALGAADAPSSPNDANQQQDQQQAAPPPDPSGGNYSSQDQNQQANPASTHPVDINDSLGVIQDAYASLKSSMLGGGSQQAGNIPTVPAGPGGDSPSTNPFPTKTPAIPFGKLADNQSAPRPIGPAPNGGPVKPFNPRDFLPGGSETSDSGAIPDEQDQAAA